MKRIVQIFVLAVFVFVMLLVGMPASSAFAFDPPWPAGLPWPTTVPWPTANPLQLGVPWSPSIQTYPVYVPPVVSAPAPLPPVVLSSGSAVATPLPPIAPAVSAPVPLPPVVLPSGSVVATPLPPIAPAASAPAPLPPVVAPSNPPAPVSVASPATNPSGGSNRSDALSPSDTWRTLNAGGSVWYKIGTGGVHMDVWLDASPHTGVEMAIYAPDGSDQPIGRGTPANGDPTRLLWSGGHWNGEGNWYALITNSNPVPVQYKVTSTQQDISNKTCWSYWEYIGPNPVYWTKCQ